MAMVLGCLTRYMDVPLYKVLEQGDLFERDAMEREVRGLLACTDEQADVIAEKVLTKSLRCLMDERESVENRWDVWCWLHRVDQPGERSFSFERCARSVGVDIDELREQLCSLLLQRDAVPEEPDSLVTLGNHQQPWALPTAWNGVAP